MVLVVMGVVEQRLQAVLEVVNQGRTVTEVAERYGVAHQTVHRWLRRYKADGLDGLEDRSHRPHACPHQMTARVEAALVALRMVHPHWGPNVSPGSCNSVGSSRWPHRGQRSTGV